MHMLHMSHCTSTYTFVIHAAVIEILCSWFVHRCSYRVRLFRSFCKDRFWLGLQGRSEVVFGACWVWSSKLSSGHHETRDTMIPIIIKHEISCRNLSFNVQIERRVPALGVGFSMFLLFPLCRSFRPFATDFSCSWIHINCVVLVGTLLK